jgi:hypothetical protein
MDDGAAARAEMEEGPSRPLAGPAAPEPAASPEWGPLKKILFRFAFVYLILYNLLHIDYTLWDWSKAVRLWYAGLWSGMVRWVGPHLLHTAPLRGNAGRGGGGDTTYGYVTVFCYLVIAAVVALLWTLLDRKRRNYVRLHEWFRVCIRFLLVAAMITYGAFKVIPSQFGSPQLSTLMQPYGDFSPMGLLWTFMGASTSYTIFAGTAEMLGGLLLIFRRTMLLGALVTIGAMSNVVMLNLSYDVTVKLYSIHLLAMAIFLVLPDLRRLANLFVLNRPVEPVEMRPLFASPRLHRGALVLRTLLVLYLLGFGLWWSYSTSEFYGPQHPGPIPGLWNVEEFVMDGQPHPPLVTDGTRWRRVISDHYEGELVIQLMDDSRQRYFYEADPKTHGFVFTRRGEPNDKSTVAVAIRHPQPDIALLEGVFHGHKIQAKLRHTRPPDFLLLTRGFHWINEYPYNR